MNVNQKTAVIASASVMAALLLTGCAGSTKHEYRVSGTVKAQQIDYDCSNENLSMEMVGFGDKGGASGRSGSSKSVKKSDRKSDSSDRSSGTSGGVGGSGMDNSISRPSKPKNKGVKLDGKPDAPEKVNKVPKAVFGSRSSGCDTEYEIFVTDQKGDLYEQDVRKVDYDQCLASKVPSGQRAKLFPLCTKG